MEPNELKALIEKGIPDAKVEVVDTTGTKDHFSAVVISKSFEELSLIEQHQSVYKAVGAFMTKEVHALQLKTYSPKKWAEQNSQEIIMELSEQIKNDISQNPILLYMKGTKEMPMCAFSNQVVQILVISML